MSARIRLTNLRLVADGLEADCDLIGALPGPPVDPPPPPPPPQELPSGYNTDRNVAFRMLIDAMDAHGLTATGVQNHGLQIVDALNAEFPGLDVYLSKSDAPVWPGFGSIDVTINSGLGGWSFRPDHVTVYEPDPAKR